MPDEIERKVHEGELVEDPWQRWYEQASAALEEFGAKLYESIRPVAEYFESEEGQNLLAAMEQAHEEHQQREGLQKMRPGDVGDDVIEVS